MVEIRDGASGEMSSDLGATIRLLEKEVDRHPIHKNPFLKEIGEMDINQLRAFLIQQYLLSSYFSQDIAAVYARIPDVESKTEFTRSSVVALPLVDIILKDLYGSRDSKSRSSMYINLFSYSALDVKEHELLQAKQLPSTSKFLEFRKDLCLNKPILSAVSGLGFMELAVGKIYESYIYGARKVDRDIPLGYFNAHVRDGSEDYKKFKGILLKLGPSQEDNAQDLIENGAMSLLNARDQWYKELRTYFFPGKVSRVNIDTKIG